MHLIGRAVKQKSAIFWVADFRDPWSNWDLLDKLKTSRFAKWLHLRYENTVLQNADLVLATSPRQALDLKNFGAKHTFSVTNGFLANTENVAAQQFEKFRITHLGLLNELRNPVEFWEVLNEIAQENAAFAEVLEVALYGIVGDSVREEFKKWPALASKVLVNGYLNQSQLKAEMAAASVLLVVQNRSENATRIIPYKLFEYLPMQRPILQLGAGFGDSNDILNAFDFCYALDVSNKEAMKDAIQILFKNWQNKKEISANSDLEKYTHPYLAKKLVAEISRLKNE
jgi:glycosyltransferase involved in cell wall biosynthesis